MIYLHVPFEFPEPKYWYRISFYDSRGLVAKFIRWSSEQWFEVIRRELIDASARGEQ